MSHAVIGKFAKQKGLAQYDDSIDAEYLGRVSVKYKCPVCGCECPPYTGGCPACGWSEGDDVGC